LSVAEFNRIQDLPGDSFYARAHYTSKPGGGGGGTGVGGGGGGGSARKGGSGGGGVEDGNELMFSKGDVLYVDNTMLGGVMGAWRAWTVDGEGNKIKCGAIVRKSR